MMLFRAIASPPMSACLKQIEYNQIYKSFCVGQMKHTRETHRRLDSDAVPGLLVSDAVDWMSSHGGLRDYATPTLRELLVRF